MATENEKEDLLLLDKQLCFPLYACARKIVAAYHPFLKALGLTYTQYVTMMVIWEKKEISVHELGDILYLDSGTLTPVLKKLESFGYIERHRSTIDERVVEGVGAVAPGLVDRVGHDRVADHATREGVAVGDLLPFAAQVPVVGDVVVVEDHRHRHVRERAPHRRQLGVGL